MPNKTFMAFAALALALCGLAFTTTARADEAWLERAALAQPEAPPAETGAVRFNQATYIATGAPRSLLVPLPQTALRQKPRRSTSG